jgi:hypothetical protein
MQDVSLCFIGCDAVNARPMLKLSDPSTVMVVFRGSSALSLGSAGSPFQSGP